MEWLKFNLVVILGVISAANINGEVISNQIYALDNNLIQRGEVLTLTVNPDTKIVALAGQNSSNPHQRFIARVNADKTFTLFSEAQPWNWVDHIVESTKYIRIRKVPQVLGMVGGTKQVVEQNYKGKNNNAQKWYLVTPTGADGDTGVITNVQLRLCINGQGEGQPLTLAPCNWSDPNQIFRLAVRTADERCSLDD